MKKYISPGSWFSFEYPESWHEFEDEAGSFLFYNPDVWSGNFRISASLDASPDFAAETMQDELEQYADATLVKFGGREYVYSRETFEEGGSWYTSHFWVTGAANMALYCTFTVAKDQPITDVNNVLASLKLYNPMQPACREVVGVRLMEVAAINEAFDWASKSVKKRLKKDFSAKTADSITYLGQLIDEDGSKHQRDTQTRVGLVLGCFLIDEVEGVEWVTLVDGKTEVPALYYSRGGGNFSPMSLKQAGNSVVDPVKVVAKLWAEDDTRTLAQLYEELLGRLL